MRLAISLFLRNLFFTVVNPGLVAGLIPYLILGNKAEKWYAQPFHFYHYAGILMAIPGVMILLYSIVCFAIDGLGTLSPADPTKDLVISGLYRFTRNPMYVGVLLILFGEALFFQSAMM